MVGVAVLFVGYWFFTKTYWGLKARIIMSEVVTRTLPIPRGLPPGLALDISEQREFLRMPIARTVIGEIKPPETAAARAELYRKLGSRQFEMAMIKALLRGVPGELRRNLRLFFGWLLGLPRLRLRESLQFMSLQEGGWSVDRWGRFLVIDAGSLKRETLLPHVKAIVARARRSRRDVHLAIMIRAPLDGGDESVRYFFQVHGSEPWTLSRQGLDNALETIAREAQGGLLDTTVESTTGIVYKRRVAKVQEEIMWLREALFT